MRDRVVLIFSLSLCLIGEADAIAGQKSCGSWDISVLRARARNFSDGRGNFLQNAEELEKIRQLAAEECPELFERVEKRYFRRLAQRAARECLIRAREAMPAVESDREAERIGRSLSFCGQLIQEDTKDEAAEFQERYEVLREKRKSACPDATVDTSSMGPVRDQGDIGWCYAHAAADLVSHRLKRRISAVDLAMNYNDSPFFRLWKKFGASEFGKEGGRTVKAISLGLDKGFCPDEKLRGEIGRASSLIGAYQRLEELRAAYDEAPSPDLACDGYELMQKISPGFPVKSFVRVLLKKSRDELFETVRKVSCRERIPAPAGMMAQVMHTPLSSSSAMQKMDELLTQGQPVGINYQYMTMWDENPAARHANVVVGRRFFEGVCEYQIRNTYGSGWGNGGYRWASEKKVRASLTGIVYLE